MHRFFVSQDRVFGDKIQITGGDVAHISRVLRMSPGDRMMVNISMNTECLAQISTIDKDEVWADIVEIREIKRELPVEVVLFQGLPKGDKMDRIVQKAVELGAGEVVPVKTHRSIVKIDEKKAKNKVSRWQGIAESAAKQSGRGKIPAVKAPMTFQEALEEAESCDLVLIPYELCESMKETKEFLGTIPDRVAGGSCKKIGIFIGPEGGFEKEEVEKVRTMGGEEITLGKRILRTETAGICLLSILMFLLEE